MIALWLFLYLAWLVRMGSLFNLEGASLSTLLLVLPLLVLPLSRSWMRRWPGAFRGWPLRMAGLVALGASLAFAHWLNLDFWDTRRLPTAALAGLMGLTFQWVALAVPEESSGPGLWIWVAFWEYAGGWHAALTPVGLGLGACLAAFGWFPRQPVPSPSDRPVRIWPALLLLGLALPKPVWDHLQDPAWARHLAAFALGVAITHLGEWPRKSDRVPERVLWVALIAMLFVYVPPLAWLWAMVLGGIAGSVWARLPRPLSLASMTGALLLGLILSFVLHANAGRPVLRHLLWMGGGSSFWVK